MTTTWKKKESQVYKIFSPTSHEYLLYLGLTNLYDKKLINNSNFLHAQVFRDY